MSHSFYSRDSYTHDRKPRRSGATSAASSRVDTGAHSKSGSRTGGGSKRSKLPLIVIVLVVVLIIAGVVIFKMLPAGGSAADGPGWLHVKDTQTQQAPEPEEFPTPLVAQYGDVLIHCPVKSADLSEVLFHQASFEWALVLTTQLPEADADAASNYHGTTHAADQPTGDVYMNREALHVWRTTAFTEMDTSIDCGGAIGTQTYAPVSGTVWKIKEYQLFNEISDYEIHIHPTGHEELDVVVLHTSDLQVTEGQQVEGGVTPMSKIRDISMISGVQLEYFTPEGDPGCHVHIQVNDMNAEGYAARLEAEY